MTIMSSQQSHTPLQGAVRQLRKGLGETQEKFAHRLGTAVRTIARYEGERPPTGLVLEQLKQLANAYNLPEVASVFQEAITRELGQDHIQSVGEFYSITLTKPEEIKPVRALVEALRNPQYCQIAARAIRDLAPVIEDIQKPIDRTRRALRQGEAMLAAHRAGKTDRQIAEFFGVPIKRVREWKRANGLMDDQ
jgi:transcriptional regulator with XRE-family HTH domain